MNVLLRFQKLWICRHQYYSSNTTNQI